MRAPWDLPEPWYSITGAVFLLVVYLVSLTVLTLLLCR